MGAQAARPRDQCADVCLYHQGSAEALGPPGLELLPHAINNRGHVVGMAVYDLFNRRAFVHRRGSLVDLGTLGGSLSTALAINDAGTIVGLAEIRRGVFHPFAYSRGEMRDLADLLGSTAGPAAINDTGDIAGIAVEPSADGEPRQVLFLYAKGRRIELGALPGAEFYGVRGLNNRREVVGYASIAGSLTGIHYRRGALRELNDLVDPSDPCTPTSICTRASTSMTADRSSPADSITESGSFTATYSRLARYPVSSCRSCSRRPWLRSSGTLTFPT